MSFVSIRSATLLGVQGAPVDIEIHLGMGLPGFTILAIAMAGDALTLDQLVLRTRRDVVDIAFALGRMESMGWVVNNGGWWEVLGAQTPAGYGGNHGSSYRLGD